MSQTELHAKTSLRPKFGLRRDLISAVWSQTKQSIDRSIVVVVIVLIIIIIR